MIESWYLRISYTLGLHSDRKLILQDSHLDESRLDKFTVRSLSLHAERRDSAQSRPPGRGRPRWC